jgi:hypothetical protein
MNQTKDNISKIIMKQQAICHLIISSSHHLIFFAFCFLILSCGNNSNSELSVSDIRNPATAEGIDKQLQANMPEILFDNLSYDFGKVIQGEILSYTFHFKNVGKSSLLIIGIEASCGCTTSSPPKAPVKPGEKGEISITFDSKYKIGEVTSYLLVTANTYPANNMLSVSANVLVP